MSGKSNIEWTDDTWSPVVGCTRVSRGCDFCYAFALHDKRHIAWKRGRWPSAPAQYHQPFSHVQLLPDRLRDPYHWRKPRRVFVNSMADLWHPDVPDAFILDVWLTMRANPRHTFQILTKRPRRMAAWCRETFAAVPSLRSLPNVWLGVSVEDQVAADERIPELLDTPAAIRFLSCEPLLGPLDLDPFLMEPWEDGSADGARVAWVIVGGESGPHARPMELAWAADLKAQCEAASVWFFMKQLGSVASKRLGLHHPHGADWREWPIEVISSLYKREWPVAELLAVARGESAEESAR
jgi:protein gp37